MKKTFLSVLAGVVLVAFGSFAFAGSTGFNAIRLTPGANDTYSIEAENTSGTDILTMTPAGALYFSGTMTGSFDISGATDFDYAQTRQLNPKDWMKSIWVASPLLSDSYGNISSASAGPYLRANNGVWGVYWNASDTASIMYPAQRVTKWASGSNIAWRALVRWTGTATTPTSASKYLQWSLMVNTGDSTITTASTAMTAVAIPAYTTASQSILTLTPSAAAQASLVEGAWYTIMIGPTAHNVASGTGAGDLYLIGFEEYRP